MQETWRRKYALHYRQRGTLTVYESRIEGSCFENEVRTLRIRYTSVFMENPGRMDVSAEKETLQRQSVGLSDQAKGPA